jgi:hypothetical protein
MSVPHEWWKTKPVEDWTEEARERFLQEVDKSLAEAKQLLKDYVNKRKFN